MAYIIRDDEIVPIAIPVGKRIKIGLMYNRPVENYVSNDQLWIQDIYAFNILPWYAVRNRAFKYLVGFSIWGSIVYMMNMLARYYL
jgi:hypothetical protein